MLYEIAWKILDLWEIMQQKIDIYNFSLMSFTVELGKQGRSTNLKNI